MIVRCVAPILAVPLLLAVQLIAGAQHLVPSSIQSCIRQLNTNHAPVKAAFLNGSHKERGKIFYFLNLFPPKIEQGVRDAVISFDSSGCQVLAQYFSGNPIPVTRSLPLTVARGLTLNILKADVAKLGGRQKYQARLNLAAKNTGRLYLSPNEVWAHRQLGISIPSSTKILPRPSR